MNQIVYTKRKLSEYKVVLIVLLFCVIFLSFIFSLINMKNHKIIPNISIAEIELSNLTIEQAQQKLEKDFAMNNTDSTIDIIVDGQKYTTPLTNTGIVPDYEQMSQLAYNVGRDGNIISNNYKILGSYIFGYNLAPTYIINDDIFMQLIKTLTENITTSKVDDTYKIDDDYITITKGTTGISIDTENLKQDIISNYINNENQPITATLSTFEAQKVDLDYLYTQIHKSPTNAQSLIENDTVVYKEAEQGISFNLEEAKFLYNNTSEQIIKIPLIITQPSITINDLIKDAFGEILATYTSKYKESEKNRTVNVKLATSKIDGTILLPGQEFSFNKVVGERTSKNGFKVATIYSANKLAQGLGGGICQVSSTLYNVALLADLNIVERKNHQLTVSYVPLGQDATVVYGSIDFRFTNNRTKPVKITAEAKNGVLTINLLGSKEAADNGKEVIIKNVTHSTKPFTTQTITDDTMKKGEQIIIQNGGYGYTVSTYKIIKINGTEISNTLLHKDTYNPFQQIVKVGTKVDTPIPTPETPETPETLEPEPQPEPTPEPEPQPEENNNSNQKPSLPPGWDVPENNMY